MQRDWFQVFHRHFLGERDYVAQLVYLAHGIVEDAGDNASVAVAGRAGVAVAEVEFADEGAALFVEGEDQVHALGIVGTADEAGVAGEFEVFGVVAVGLTGHAGILSDIGSTSFGRGFSGIGIVKFLPRRAAILYTYRF